MDAQRMGRDAIREGIGRGHYELTGILPTGELTIALVSDLDRTILAEAGKTGAGESGIRKVSEALNMPNEELMQVFLQMHEKDLNKCNIKNGLRIRQTVCNRHEIQLEINRLSDIAYEITRKLEKVLCLFDEVNGEYFGKYDNKNEKDCLGIVWDFARNSTFVDIIFDYVFQSQRDLKELENKLNKIELK